MNANVSTPAAHVQPADNKPFGSDLAAYLERRENARRIAKEMSIEVPWNLNDWQVRKIEEAYAQHQADYAAWLEARESDEDMIAATIRAEEEADALPPHCR